MEIEILRVLMECRKVDTKHRLERKHVRQKWNVHPMIITKGVLVALACT